MANYCGNCGKFIGDSMIYGARHIDKPYCSAWCANDADLKWEAEQIKQRRLDDQFPDAEQKVNRENAFAIFQIVFTSSLCDKCTHYPGCKAATLFIGRSICHCRYFHRREEKNDNKRGQ